MQRAITRRTGPAYAINPLIRDGARLLMRLAEHSGGGTLEPPATVNDCPDWEDNRILDLVADVGAYLLVSEDTDLTAMSPWRGVPVLRPRQFADRVDAMRRHHRRHR